MSSSSHPPAPADRRAADRRAALELLPAEDASPDAYADLPAGVPGDDAHVLRAMLLELWRRQDGAGDEALHAALSEAADAVEGRLAAIRLERRSSEVQDAERRQPLRRRLLDELASGPRTPTDVARRLAVTKEAVSRALGRLADEGLVAADADPDDRRRRVYGLTAAGAVARRDHAALGRRPAEPQVPDARQAAAFLRDAVAEAVRRRRHADDLDAAVTRLRAVVREAQKLGDGRLELQARRELMTSLRKASRKRAWTAEAREMSRIAAGARHDLEAALALPAFAHLRYERGRLDGDQSDAVHSERIRQLTAAADAFNALGDAGLPGDDWRAREAWAWFGMAEHHRQRTDLRRTLVDADRAARLFSAVEDVYGFASCLLLVGFGLRLRGEFGEALAVLSRATALAHENGFERLRADSLMQLGETHRCQGRIEEARELLEEAHQRARLVDAAITWAFAESALGAAAFEAGDGDAALELLASAQETFEARGHRPGLALTLRRRAVVQRRLIADAGRARRERADEVTRLLHDATRRYVSLASPAGVIACLVEEGRLALDCGGEPSESWRRRLIGWAQPQARRLLLQTDPWVPAMLEGLAADLRLEPLERLSRTVLAGAEETRAEQQEDDWWFVHGLVEADIPAPAPRPAPNEMAGEPRRLLVAPTAVM